MSHVGTLPNLDRLKVGSRNSYPPLRLCVLVINVREYSRDLQTCCLQIYSNRDRLFADDIDVIDYCSVSVYSEGTRIPEQKVLDFDVHEPFLKVKKWN